MREVSELDACSSDHGLQALHFLVPKLEELVEQAALVHEFQGRRVDGVAAEIAQKILMLLQYHDLHAGPREQEAEHHAGRPAAGDGAVGLDFFGCRRVPRHPPSTYTSQRPRWEHVRWEHVGS